MDIALREAERLFVAMCAPILLLVGYRLFVLGVTGQIELSAKTDKWYGKATNVSPGALCFMLCVVLGVYVLRSPIKTGTYAARPPDDNSATATATARPPSPVISQYFTDPSSLPEKTGNQGQVNPAATPPAGKQREGRRSPVPAKASPDKPVATYIEWSGIGGKGTKGAPIPLSWQLRYVISELYLSDQMFAADPVKMEENRKTIEKNFGIKELPSSKDLNDIAVAERTPETKASEELLKSCRDRYFGQ